MKLIHSCVVLTFLAASLLSGAMLAAGSAMADTSPAAHAPAAESACGYPLSETVYDVWRDLGGEGGRLGCATTSDVPTSTSPKGSTAKVAVFGQNGEIVLHASGPRAGQAYAVWGCFYRLYVQFSGTGGWLGLPIADAINTPDGSTQDFEGGTMRYTRAYRDCEANPTTPVAATLVPPSNVAQAPLDIFENATTGDRVSLAADRSVAELTAAGYQRLRGQARVLSEAAAGATALKLYRNDTRDLWRTAAAIQSERDALAAGFVFEANQGYVWTDPRPGALPLRLFRQGSTERTRLVVSPEDEREAKVSGYVFVRVEGYVAPPS